MNKPIANSISTVFIPVRDIEQARAWYADVLGFAGEGEVLFGHLFCPSMEGVGLVLDTMPRWQGAEFRPYEFPAFSFPTEDIQAAYQSLKEKGVELVTGIEHGHYFVFKDADGNHLMVSAC